MSILSNSTKSLVIANKLKVSEKILKANRLDYLVSKAKMGNLESIPLEALNNMLASRDKNGESTLNYDSIISLERSSKKLRENIRNIVTSGILLDKLLEKYGLTKQELPNELIQNLTYDDVKRLENNETFQLILTQKWLRQYNQNYTIEQLKALEFLNLINNQIVDVSPLKTLTNLQELYLFSNKIVDVSPLKTLTKLKKLYLFNNQIVDVSPLSTLTKLQTLNLDTNQIVNVSPLKDLNYLENLNLSNNKIVDVSPLKDLNYLENLDLINNNIVDISPLFLLQNLEALTLLSNNNIEKEHIEELRKSLPNTKIYF